MCMHATGWVQNTFRMDSQTLYHAHWPLIHLRCPYVANHMNTQNIRSSLIGQCAGYSVWIIYSNEHTKHNIRSCLIHNIRSCLSDNTSCYTQHTELSDWSVCGVWRLDKFFLTSPLPYIYAAQNNLYGKCRAPVSNHQHTEKSFRNLIKPTRNQIVFTIFRLIWNQTDVRLVPNQWENGKYNLISVWLSS